MRPKDKDRAPSVQIAVVAALEANGFRCKIVPASRLSDLIGELQERVSNDEIDKEVREKYMDNYFDKTYPDQFPSPRSLLIIAKAVPQVRVAFEWHGRRHAAIIPPTYKDFDPPVSQVLDSVLSPAGYKYARARVPFKLLAARTGLSRYGRNNIAYFVDLGSFARLNGWWSDMPPATDPWQEPAMLAECEKCKACQKACPTGAISGDRFLVHAGKCLTFFNESEQPFPPWIEPEWHNALVGCLRCQLCCPANKHVKDWIVDGESFTEKETAMLLDCPKPDAIPAETRSKLEKIGLEDDTVSLGRNLRVLLDRS
jgi:epoxyqueuosine reductase